MWVSFRQAAFPGKNAHGDQRAAWVTLHGMDRDRQGESSCSEHSPPPVVAAGSTLSTQKNNRASRDRLRVKSDFALCFSIQLHNRGCENSQHPMITQLSMTHQGSQGWFPTNNPESTASPPLNYISNSNPAQTCTVFDSHRRNYNYFPQRQANRYLRIST